VAVKHSSLRADAWAFSIQALGPHYEVQGVPNTGFAHNAEYVWMGIASHLCEPLAATGMSEPVGRCRWATGEETVGLFIRGIALLAGVLVTTATGWAQDYPTRPIRLLQGFAPGGNADTTARILAEEASKGLGQQIVVESRPGAGGNLASDQVAKATPDGYTLVLLVTSHVISPALYKSLPYDPIKDFAFISTVAEFSHLIVVNAARSPFKNLKDLVVAGKAKPGSLTYGTAGVGTGQHLAGELFNTSIGAKMVHVPYKGDSGAVAALLAGDVDFIVAPLPPVKSNIDAGTFRALATSSAKPWPGIDHVPPIGSAVPEFGEVLPWTGLATTGGTPRPIVDKLHREFARVIALPDVSKRLRSLGGEPRSSTPEELAGKVKSEIARWIKVVEAANIPKR
jgi:tripartite-type tricarboxylate transporter receptor subunit TctC